jgi:hypothetical protein
LTATVEISLPRCVQERQPQTFVAVSTDDLPNSVFLRDIQRLSSAELICQRLEFDLQRYAQSGEAEIAQRIWHKYNQAALFLARPQIVKKLNAADRERWERVTEAVNRIEQPADSAEEAPPDPYLSAVYAENTQAGLLISAEQGLRYRLIRHATMSWGMCLVLLALSFWCLPTVVGWRFSAAWEERPYAAWMLLGAIWWLCFAPQIIGAAMIAWSVWKLLWQSRSPSATSPI